jgi:glycosyltransferase involved in cell wall biosynthesis
MTFGNAALYFDPEGYSISGPKLMGRNAAGHSFLNGLFRHATVDRFMAFTDQPSSFRAFKSMAADAGVTAPVQEIPKASMGKLAEAGCVFYPGPGLGPHAWERELFGPRAWSLCGITHTTLSGRAMDGIAGVLTEPLYPWDALICTSRAVRDTVRNVLEAQGDYLAARLGATRFPMVKLPVIPLGVDCERFMYSDADTAKARDALGMTSDETVILFVGRLSFHAKAHPIAMYQALEKAASGRKITLVECGWFANDALEDAFEKTATAVCPNVRRIVLDGRIAEERRKAWGAADIFCSLSDNLQETFGITPIEAMARGIPVVVSDWDGYRDTVRDGVDGFRIRTAMPSAGFGNTLAARHALGLDTYDQFCGLTSQFVSVDPEQTADILIRLIDSPALRREIGANGRARARDHFDWARIIPRYQSLWAELAEERRSAPEFEIGKRRMAGWPARMDPFSSFASYASMSITGETKLARSAEFFAERISDLRKLPSFPLIDRSLPSHPDVMTVLEQIPFDRTIRVAELCPPGEVSQISVAIVAWALKIGAVRVA